MYRRVRVQIYTCVKKYCALVLSLLRDGRRREGILFITSEQLLPLQQLFTAIISCDEFQLPRQTFPLQGRCATGSRVRSHDPVRKHWLRMFPHSLRRYEYFDRRADPFASNLASKANRTSVPLTIRQFSFWQLPVDDDPFTPCCLSRLRGDTFRQFKASRLAASRSCEQHRSARTFSRPPTRSPRTGSR